MTNRNVEDIDQLFREGLNPEQDHFSFSEDDWVKMEHRLERYDRRKRGIFWLTRVGSVAALLLLFFAIGILLRDNQEQIIQQAEVRQKDQQQNTKQPTETAPFGKLDKGQQPGNLNTAKQPENLSKGQQPTADYSEKEKTVINTAETPDSNLAFNKNMQDKSSANHPVTGMPDKKPSVLDSLQQQNFDIEDKTPEPAVIAKEQNPSISEPVPSTEEKPSSEKEPILASIEEPTNRSKTEPSAYKMALTAMAAPAYNGVNNLNNGSMGNDFGLLVSFAIARNWSISTGGIYAKKLYDTGFRDYNPKNNIWKEYYPRTVNADCRVLDIPVNLSYTFIKGKNRTFSAGSGISSYIMLRENYHFTYARTNTDNPLDYEVVNENRHWLSVLNFQATLEQRISKRLSVSLQPYFKLPLGPVGFAGVKLQSFGMAANVNWNFNL